MNARMLLACLLSAVAGALAMYVVQRDSPSVSADERYYRVPGDVNGDGNLNIADPMFLLNYIFAFGPAPVPCEPCLQCPECPEVALAPVLTTGQTKCFNAVGAEIQCDDPGFPRQDGAIRAGLPWSYRDNGDGTITDNVTSLTWTKAPLDGVTWQGALEHCSTLTLGGESDWRLPNVNELLTITHYSANPVAPGPPFAIESTSWIIWTSTTYAFPAQRDLAWAVVFSSGRVDQFEKESEASCLAVRGGLPQ